MAKHHSSSKCPNILNQISPGVQVTVWFDGGPAAGRTATFLGFQDHTPTFLTTQTGGPQVIFVPCNQIQAVALRAPMD